MLWDQTWQVFVELLFFSQDIVAFALKFVPFVLFLELPLYVIGWMGVLRRVIGSLPEHALLPPFFPKVSCVITCYAEGQGVRNTMLSLLEQIYPGHIEIIAVLDGAAQNRETYKALKAIYPLMPKYRNRSFRIIPKIQRGGRVSSLNVGLQYAGGEILMALDGDTSFDNQMVACAVRPFRDPHVVAASGPLRVRNARKSLVTRLQHLEYLLTVHAAKLGLAEWNAMNNVPGAFGIFRKSFVDHVGGWNTGTAEDLDLTLRIKQYLRRHPQLKIVFIPGAVAHADVPEDFRNFLRQRLRWDGDLIYIYFNKHGLGISPGLMGWRNFLFLLWYGVIFQVVMPFMIALYTVFLFIAYPAPIVLGTMLLIYVFYFLLTLAQLLLYLALLSDRPKDDLRAFWILPIFPAFQFCVRLWSAAANLNQIFNAGHLDSAMAPLWVLRKGKP